MVAFLPLERLGLLSIVLLIDALRVHFGEIGLDLLPTLIAGTGSHGGGLFVVICSYERFKTDRAGAFIRWIERLCHFEDVNQRAISFHVYINHWLRIVW